MNIFVIFPQEILFPKFLGRGDTDTEYVQDLAIWSIFQIYDAKKSHLNIFFLFLS